MDLPIHTRSSRKPTRCGLSVVLQGAPATSRVPISKDQEKGKMSHDAKRAICLSPTSEGPKGSLVNRYNGATTLLPPYF